MNKIKLGDHIKELVDIGSNGSDEQISKNLNMKDAPDYAYMIRTVNLNSNNFKTNLKYVTKESYEYFKKTKMYGGEIIINKIGCPGTVGLMPFLDKPISLGLNQYALTFYETLNQKFMYYKLKHIEPYLKSIAHGTTTKTLTKEEIKNIEIEIPEKLIQDKIEYTLSTIDKKIDINNQINNNLEELAYTMFLHNFANKAANGTIGDIIEENEKSKVKVGDAKDIKGEYPFFTSGESILEWNDYLVDGRNLFLNTGGNADVKFYVGKATYSTDTWSITSKKEMSDYLYLYLKTIKDELDRKFFHGSGLKHLQKPLFKQEKIYIPKQEELREFNNKVQTMFDTISANKMENEKLNSLKEYLLPLLMNGQINVDDIEI